MYVTKAMHAHILRRTARRAILLKIHHTIGMVLTAGLFACVVILMFIMA